MDSGIQIVQNEKGKGLIATKNFKVGDVIFEETPLICSQFAWNRLYGYKACDHCMRPLETAEENARRLTNKNITLPYPECCQTRKDTITECVQCGIQYCSENCRDIAFQQYHRTICLQTKERNLVHPLEILEETWRQMHFPPESCNVMIITRIIAMVQQASNPEEMMGKFMQFCHRTVNEDANLAHKLVGEPFISQISRLRHYISECMSSEGVEHWFTEHGFQSLLALLGTNGQGIGSSAVSVWVKHTDKLSLPENKRSELDNFVQKLYEDLEKESGMFLNNEGSGLFCLQSACNHSCEPNAEPTFMHNDYTLSMVALKNITAGEEILISYLDECVLGRSRHTRQKILGENYLFRCQCNKCLQQADDPDVTSEEEMSESD